MPRMLNLNIGPQVASGLTSLLSLPPEQYEEFKRVATAARPSLNPAKLIRQLSADSTIPIGAIEAITMGLLGLFAAMNSFEPPEFVEIVCSSAERGQTDVGASSDAPQATAILAQQLRGEPQARELLAKRLLELLHCGGALEVTSKALDVMTENANVFSTMGARVISDIRPLFTTDLTPSAVVIVHQLKITYYEGPTHRLRSFFVALDESDVRYLRETLERAEAKTEHIRAAIRQSSMQYLDPEEQD